MTCLFPRGVGLAAIVVGVSFSTQASAGLRVAIVASAEFDSGDPRFADVRVKLLGTGEFEQVAVFNALLDTPSLQELERYESLLVWSNRDFANADALGDVLAAYVDRGGGVVLSIFANTTSTFGRYLGGRWHDDGYAILPVGGGTLSSGGARELGRVVIPGHPIMEGVDRFRGGTASFRPFSFDLTDHGVLVAQWDDESTLVATSSRFRRRADLGMYPPSNAVTSTFWDQTTDGARLMANSLVYTARCRADLNRDGRVDFFDYLDFVDLLAIEDGGADYDRNGTVDFFDYLEFVPDFLAGCD